MEDLTIHDDLRLQLDLSVRTATPGRLGAEPRVVSTPDVEDPRSTITKIHPKTQPDWNNLDVLHRNTLPPRSHFHVYDSEAAALSANVGLSRAQLLSGSWGFDLAPSPFAGPKHFWKSSFDHAKWPLIKVPGHWQLQGFGKGPQYTNVNYPFPVDPPNVPFDENECGRYVTNFDVLPGVKDGKQFRLRFEGVDAAFTVWLNGKEVGYSQGSRNPSEFDVTEFLNLNGQGNTLCVEVYQRCDGSYIEDQDQWWLSGIFRDVWLHSFPETYFEDFQIQTLLDDDYRDAQLSVKTTVSQSDKHVHLKLFDADGKIIAETSADQAGTFTDSGNVSLQNFDIKTPHKWTAETPYLYTLLLEVDGLYTSHKVGFRRAELINGVFCVNGSPIKIRGVNRHEHHPETGRAVPYAFLRNDLRTMKLFSINAIRTSHYPNDPRFYDLANEFGFWVIDEADLECHGFENAGGLPASYTSDNPEWREAYLDRARQLVARDKNHPCVIMWSLGNEAFYGRNHQAMYDEVKSMDQTRLIHYEQDYDAKTADVFSRMYTSVDGMITFGEEKDWKKPFVMCEFGHAMGNGPGGLKEYVDAFYKYPRLMGGFIWEWANHGLLTTSKDGTPYFGYGGDFKDVPNDGNFVMDGLCNSNHNQGPGLNNYSALIQPVQIVSMHGPLSIEIINRYDFRTLNHLRCYWSIVSDRNQIIGREIVMPKDIKPHSTAILHLQQDFPTTLAAGAWLELEFVDTEVPMWAYPNRTVARCQVQLTPPTSLGALKALELNNQASATTAAAAPRITSADGDLIYRVTLENDKTFGFDTSTGKLSFLSYTSAPSGENLITEPFTLDFYRALTDNDRPVFGQEWLDARLHQTRQHFSHMNMSQPTTCPETGARTCEVVVHSRVAPPVLAWAVHVITTYTFTATTCAIRVQARPSGPFLPSTFARFGLSFGIKDVNIIEWFGRGPEQSYSDFKAAQFVNTWGWSVDGMWHDYEFPQENGNRTDVSWVELRQTWGGEEKGRTLRARFGDFEGASFAVSRFATGDVDEARHPFELRDKKRVGDVLVRLDWFHQGLGTGSCGPSTAEEYQLKTGREFDVEVLLD